MTALGPSGLPSFASEVIVSRLETVDRDGDPGDTLEKIGFIVFSANTALPDRIIERLRETALSSHPVRFAAGYAIVERLPQDEATALATDLARSWPSENWGFYYSRYGQVLSRLVSASPESWADRAKKVGPGWHLDLAEPLRKLLRSSAGEPVLETAFRSALHRDLPWLLLGEARPQRLFDAVLELIYDSGIGVDVLASWCARLDETGGN